MYLVYATDGQVGYFLGRRSQCRSGMSRVHPAPMRIEECQCDIRLEGQTHSFAGTLLCYMLGMALFMKISKSVDVVTD